MKEPTGLARRLRKRQRKSKEQENTSSTANRWGESNGKGKLRMRIRETDVRPKKTNQFELYTPIHPKLKNPYTHSQFPFPINSPHFNSPHYNSPHFHPPHSHPSNPLYPSDKSRYSQWHFATKAPKCVQLYVINYIQVLYIYMG